MADNFVTNIASSSGATFRAQDVSSVYWPVSLLGWGPDGGPYVEVDDASGQGLPVQPDAGAVWAVTGTFWQATQPVSAASLPLPSGAATAANQQTDALTDAELRATAVPVSGTFWQATQPVSASSLPLPSGASTAAKQPALGTAGTASADVISVQGIASMTALKVDGSAVTQPVSGTVGVSGTVAVTQSGTWDEVGINDSGNSITVDNGGTFAVQVTSGGGGTQYSVGATPSPIVGTAMLMKDQGSGEMIAVCGEGTQLWVSVIGPISIGAGETVATTNAGTFAVQVDGSALTALQLIDNAIHVDDAAFTLGTSSGVMAMGFAGTQSVNANDACALACETDGSLHIHDGGNTITVDAPVGTPVFVRLSDGSSAISTLPVSLASVPTHAVTVASGGIASGAVASGAVASGAFASGSIATGAIADMLVDDAAFTAATSRVMPSGFMFDDVSVDSVNENDIGVGRMSANRNIYTTIRDAAGNERGVNVNASNQLAIAGPVTVVSGGIASGALASGSVASGAIASGAVASGAFASGSISSGAIASGAIADMIVDDAAFTPGTSRVLMAGFQADETATDSVNEGDAGASRMTLDRKMIVTQQPHTQGGCTIFRSLDVDETEEEVKATAGQVYGIHAMNLTNALLYLKFYNATAANVTVGTTTPVMTFPVPANNDTDGAGFVLSLSAGIAFGTAITVACTTGLADNDTGAPAANACVVQIFYA